MAANRSKTIRYFFETRTADLATNTALGTATRHDFAAINLDIPETTSRAFLSVMLRLSFRDRFTVANEITAIRTGIKLGAVAFADTDRTFTQANTGDHFYDEWTLDVTSYFNSNYGALGTQTCQAAIAVATTAASNIGGNITAELIITYEFDDTVGSTRVKTIGIPIGSHAGALSLVQQELGSDGTAPPSSGQIPALDTLLKEASVAIKSCVIEIQGTDGNVTGTTDLVPAVQIDAVAESVRGTVSQALTTPMNYRDLFNYDTSSFSTASTHTLKMRDTVVTGRYNGIGACMWVTYTYDKSATTRMLNQALIPLVGSEDDHALFGANISGTANVAADAQILYAVLDIQEPGTITLEQSAVVLRCNQVSNGGNFLARAGSQTYRTYTTPSGITGEVLIHHRTDNGAGAWTLTRGENRLPFSAYNVNQSRIGFNGAWALILYSSDVPSSGTETGNRILHSINSSYGVALTSVDIAASGAGQIVPKPFSPWKLNGYIISGRFRGSLFGAQLLLQRGTGEWDQNGFHLSATPRAYLSELASWGFDFPLTRAFNEHSAMSGKMLVDSAHRLLCVVNGLFSAWTWLTVHNLGFTVLGTLTIDGVAAADGKTIEVWAYKTNPIFAERVTSATTSGGGGTFSCTVPDNTRTYFCTHSNGADQGKSQSTTPGGSFDIEVRGASGGDTTDPTISTVSLPATSADPLVLSVGDASGLSLYQVTCRDRPDGPRYVVYSPIDGSGDSGFVPPFKGLSTVTGSGTIADPYIFTIYRRGRWPTGIPLDVRAQAVDLKGNEVNS